jgi:hypothetical protein
MDSPALDQMNEADAEIGRLEGKILQAPEKHRKSGAATWKKLPRKGAASHSS